MKEDLTQIKHLAHNTLYNSNRATRLRGRFKKYRLQQSN